MSLGTKDYINHVVKVCFNTFELSDKQRDYRSGLIDIFSKQGNLVLYPNNEVTCFKYKNETYFNPLYPKLSDNKVEINLRHLHPSLHKEMGELINTTAQLSVNQKRFEAYCNRAARCLVQQGYEVLSDIPSNDWHIVTFAFIIQVLPSTLFSKYYQQFKDNLNTQLSLNPSFKIGDINKILFELQPVINNFKEREKTCVDQIDTFMFTIDVLGF